jgi:hypothetical protein
MIPINNYPNNPNTGSAWVLAGAKKVQRVTTAGGSGNLTTSPGRFASAKPYRHGVDRKSGGSFSANLNSRFVGVKKCKQGNSYDPSTLKKTWVWTATSWQGRFNVAYYNSTQFSTGKPARQGELGKANVFVAVPGQFSGARQIYWSQNPSTVTYWS